MRILAASLVLLCPQLALAQDVEWAMQERSHAQIGVRAVAPMTLTLLPDSDARPSVIAAGGEVGLGGRLAGAIIAEVRLGHAWGWAAESNAALRDLWFGIAGNVWTDSRAPVSPVFGVSLLYHDSSREALDGIGVHLEAGIGIRAARSLFVTLGVRGGVIFDDHKPTLRIDPVFALDVAL